MIHASLKVKSNLSSADCLTQIYYFLAHLPRRESALGSTGVQAQCILYFSRRLPHLLPFPLKSW